VSPAQNLRVEQLADGLRPMRQFICKVASRCNLDCDYCYVYHHADQTWRDRPKRMALSTAAQVAYRINQHAIKHGIESVDVVLHGGEPLLVGLDYLGEWCDTITSRAPDTRISFGMQTNGVLFDEHTLEFCLKWNIQVGLSMDGPKSAQDRHRFDFQKRSSFDAVERALALLTTDEGRRLWTGFLAVIDLANDPLEVYSYFKGFEPPSIEFLLPLGHYDLRPRGKICLDDTPYADWLLAIFNVWYTEFPQTTKIRRFQDIITLMAGALSSTEEWGIGSIDFAVIEADGAIEGVDSLKTTYPGANHLGLNVFANPIDDMFAAPLVVERQKRLDHLCTTCQECPLVKVCGGGYYPHRYSRTSGFQNPSIYCADIMKLISTVHAAVSDTLRSLKARKQNAC
jgi:uncharacterized protein